MNIRPINAVGFHGEFLLQSPYNQRGRTIFSILSFERGMNFYSGQLNYLHVAGSEWCVPVTDTLGIFMQYSPIKPNLQQLLSAYQTEIQ